MAAHPFVHQWLDGFAKELDVETIQVSLAHAYPGTELFEFAKENGFIVNTTQMVDDGGHKLAQIEYPGLPREEALDVKNADQLGPIFEPYKTEIEKYITAHHRDWKTAYKAFVAKRNASQGQN